MENMNYSLSLNCKYSGGEDTNGTQLGFKETENYNTLLCHFHSSAELNLDPREPNEVIPSEYIGSGLRRASLYSVKLKGGHNTYSRSVEREL